MSESPTLPIPLTIVHNAAAQRFEAVVDGKLCECEYWIDGNTVVMQHTGVPRSLQGQGIAAALVAEALAWALRSKLEVRPVCSYVRAYLRRNGSPSAHAR